MSLEKTDQRRQKRRIGRPGAKLFCPNSGQVKEPPRPPFVGNRDCKRKERQGSSVGWRRLGHSLSCHEGAERQLARILIVEDNALNVKLFCDLLAAHGHEPRAVTDGRYALEQARDFAPDLVITDIQLPHVTGLDVIRGIRDDKKLKEVPIMAVTAYAAAADEERIRAAGAQAYVSKPISVAKFVAQVNELLGIETADAKAAETI